MKKITTRKATLRRLIATSAVMIALMSMAEAMAQNSPQKYISPVDFPLILAGNVGELRTNAFHAGIDIKGMKGVGSPMVAVADGYVWRVGVSPVGYGNVIYIKHTDGAISVYGHMHEFEPKIAAWVKRNQYAKKSFYVDLFPSADQFPVKQGQKIGTVGNSGSSGGAHVHLEIRDPKSGRPTNLIKRGIYNIPDSQKPEVDSVKLYEFRSVAGIQIPVLKQAKAVSSNMVFKLNGRGYLVYHVVDYKDGRTNTMGIYSIEQKVDDRVNYSFRMDYTDFSLGRYINTLVQYGDHVRTAKRDVHRAYVSPHNGLFIYGEVYDRGIIDAKDTPRRVQTTFTDDAGNKTVVKLTIEKDNTPSPERVAKATEKAVKWNEPFSFAGDGFAVTIPARALYEDALLDFDRVGDTVIVGYNSVPLHNRAVLTMEKPKGDGWVISKMGLMSRDRKGRAYWAGGAASANGQVSISLSSFGRYWIAQDTEPPVITPQSLAAQGSTLLKFKIEDTLSGISTYVLTVDGTWELAEYDAKTNTLTHRFKRNSTPTDHAVRLEVTDSKGNKAVFTRNIKW